MTNKKFKLTEEQAHSCLAIHAEGAYKLPNGTWRTDDYRLRDIENRSDKKAGAKLRALVEGLNAPDRKASLDTDTRFTEVEQEVEDTKAKLAGNLVAEPYFNAACRLVLFSRNNTQSFPASKKALIAADDKLLSVKGFSDLKPEDKARELAAAAAKALGFELTSGD